MKKLVSLILAVSMLLSLVSFAAADEQTAFNVLSGISALSGGYDNNEVLLAMQEQAGVKITWDTWSDSLNEVVGTRIRSPAPWWRRLRGTLNAAQWVDAPMVHSSDAQLDLLC